MTAPAKPAEPGAFADLIATIENSPIVSRANVIEALAYVRDGVITGEGPTIQGRAHFSRALDADDANWCERILGAPALRDQPISREEAEVLFQINDAAADRDDDGAFDALFARAIVHHAAAASGLPVPSRAVALSPATDIESWAPTTSVGVNTEVLEWIATQMRVRRRSSVALMAVAAMLIGVTTLPVAQSLSSLADLGV